MSRPLSGLNRFLGRIPLHLAVILMCLIWLLPTLGLFVTSLRQFEDVNETGWWMATAPPRGTSDYQLFCSSCHGTEGKMIPETDLSDPEEISKLRRSYHLAATFGTEYDGQVHVPEEDRPNERQTADIVAYLKRISGLDTREFPTLDNYVDALTGFIGRPGDTYLEAVERGDLIPGERTGDVLKDALTTPRGMGRAFINSLLVAVPSTILPIVLASFAAYAFAWLDFKGRNVLFAILVGLQVVPLQMALIPIFRIYTKLNLNGTFLAVWLFHTGFGMPYAIYLLRNFIGGLPRDLFKSIYLDGASHWTAFTKLAIPLAMPAIASLAIFQFLWVWNDLLIALVFLGGTTPVLTYRISNLVTSLGAGWHLLTAAAFISMLLPLIVFFALQRFFVRGMLAGAVKG